MAASCKQHAHTLESQDAALGVMKADKKVTVCDVNPCHDWALRSQVCIASAYAPLD